MHDLTIEEVTGLQIDWVTSYEEFREEHGGCPVECDGLLLFHDAWRHEMSFTGRAYPPPSDERSQHRLKQMYWSLRRNVVTKELGQLTKRMKALEDLSSRRHAKVKLIDQQDVKGRMEWLREDVELCDGMLQELEQEAP